MNHGYHDCLLIVIATVDCWAKIVEHDHIRLRSTSNWLYSDDALVVERMAAVVSFDNLVDNLIVDSSVELSSPNTTDRRNCCCC